MTSKSTQIVYEKIRTIINEKPDKKTNINVEINAPKMIIKFNRPKRYNAFTIDMYVTVKEAINQAENNDSIKFIILMGEGGNFSSGNDLTNFTNP